jgi:hypothetical protein
MRLLCFYARTQGAVPFLPGSTGFALPQAQPVLPVLFPLSGTFCFSSTACSNKRDSLGASPETKKDRAAAHTAPGQERHTYITKKRHFTLCFIRRGADNSFPAGSSDGFSATAPPLQQAFSGAYKNALISSQPFELLNSLPY